MPSRAGLHRAGVFVVAVLVLAAVVGGLRSGWWDLRPGGGVFESYVAPVFFALFAVAALVALKSPTVGAGLAAFAVGALSAFAGHQLVSAHAAIVIGLVTLPVVLWVVLAVSERDSETTSRTAIVGVGALAVTAGLGVATGGAIYDNFWGPTHPTSVVSALPDSPIAWVWSGRVTATEAEVRAHPAGEYESVRLVVSTNEDFEDPTWVEPSDESGRVVGFGANGLDPDTRYHYAVEVDGVLDLVRTGSFTTFGEGATSYTVAIGACARVGSNGAVFDTIRELDPLLYLIVGDFHYGDTGVNDIEEYREVLDITLTQPGQAALYRSTPIAYVWDDHDYGLNDADGNSPSREAAMAAYREHVPSYELGGPESAVYQAFTIGRVRFVVTDARSARNLADDEKPGPVSMLGSEQKAWFKQEIVEASQSHELVIWVNPVPWVAEAREGADHWAGFADERRELADHITTNGVNNLLMVSSDAHMVAIDDGSNTDYSTLQTGGFPLLHSAALDRPGSIKGGPYSEGAIAGGGQFATIDIADDGEVITASLTGVDWEGNELMTYDFSTADMER